MRGTRVKQQTRNTLPLVDLGLLLVDWARRIGAGVNVERPAGRTTLRPAESRRTIK